MKELRVTLKIEEITVFERQLKSIRGLVSFLKVHTFSEILYALKYFDAKQHMPRALVSLTCWREARAMCALLSAFRNLNPRKDALTFILE